MVDFKSKTLYLTPKDDNTAIVEKVLREDLGFDIVGYIDSIKDNQINMNNDSFEKNDAILIFSPHNWVEIAQSFNTEVEIFNIEILNDKLTIKAIPRIKKNINNVEYQKEYWENHLKDFHANNNLDFKKYGNEWGDPENKFDMLGDYLSVKNKLISKIACDSKVLEIGTLGGKWTSYMLNAKNITCVDINEYFIEIISNRFSDHIKKFDFYVSKGNELNGIKDNSMDIVFCLDTFARVEKEYIFDYLKEISRVLKDNGCAILHLPNSDLEYCKERDFTDINTHEIETILDKYFDNYTLDSNSLVHGTLVYINY